MIHAVAIDDEPLPLVLLTQFCERINFISLDKTFTKVNEAKDYLKENKVDLLFLDIQMPTATGIEFYKSLNKEIMVIFTTAFSEYAMEGFNLNAVDYLLKPYSFNRFLEAANKASSLSDYLKFRKNQEKQYLYVRSDYSLVQIDIDEIVLVESFADYLDILVLNGRKTRIRMTLKAILEKLPPGKFVRVHRSFIVSLQQIEKIRKKTIYVGGREIPLSSSYESDFHQQFSKDS